MGSIAYMFQWCCVHHAYEIWTVWARQMHAKVHNNIQCIILLSIKDLRSAQNIYFMLCMICCIYICLSFLNHACMVCMSIRGPSSGHMHEDSRRTGVFKDIIVDSAWFVTACELGMFGCNLRLFSLFWKLASGLKGHNMLVTLSDVRRKQLSRYFPSRNCFSIDAALYYHPSDNPMRSSSNGTLTLAREPQWTSGGPLAGVLVQLHWSKGVTCELSA